MKLVVEALLPFYPFYLGSELILIDIRKPFQSSPVSCDIAGPYPAVPFQLAPTQLRYTNLRIVTETRPVHNIKRSEGVPKIFVKLQMQASLRRTR